MDDFQIAALFLFVVVILMMTPSTIQQARKNKIRRNRPS